MNDLSQLSVGVDVGGTKVAAAAVSGTTVLETHERPTVQTSGKHLVNEIEAAAREVIERAGTPVAVRSTSRAVSWSRA
jgi:predicted NBD/HSP70 family sugar kinase